MNESYLIIRLNNEFFAINVSLIKEAIEPDEITEVPETAKYIKGIMNFRGNILPVVDMRMKFNFPGKENLENSVIVVLSFIVKDKIIDLGAIVDSVSHVVDVNLSQVTGLPEIGTKYNNDYIKGIIKYEGNFIVLLNIEKIFEADEITLVLKNTDEEK